MPFDRRSYHREYMRRWRARTRQERLVLVAEHAQCDDIIREQERLIEELRRRIAELQSS